MRISPRDTRPAAFAAAFALGVYLLAALAPEAWAQTTMSASESQGTSQNTSKGPLTFEEAGSLQRVSFTAAVEGADLVGAGRTKAGVWIGYSNVFEQDSSATHELFLDFERLVTTFTVAHGMSERLEVGGRVTFETTGGGILDGFVSGWHERLGLQNGNRDLYPSDQYIQFFRDQSGDVRLEIPQQTFSLSDVRLFAKWRTLASNDGRHVLSLRGAIRIPLQDLTVGEQRADVALMALARTSWDKWHLHGMAGRSTVRVSKTYGTLVRSSAWFGTLAAERALTESVSAITQFTLATSRLQGVDHPEIDGLVGNLVFGLAGAVGEGWRWEASFQEDIPPNSPAVDFTLGLGLRRSW